MAMKRAHFVDMDFAYANDKWQTTRLAIIATTLNIYLQPCRTRVEKATSETSI